MKTIFITGSSSGIGMATALYFSKSGWNVAATMRSLEKSSSFGREGKNIRTYYLDVTDPSSIKTAMDAAEKDFGKIDVVVNNAGFGVEGVFEAMDDTVIQKEFDTNVFGLMRVTRAFV